MGPARSRQRPSRTAGLGEIRRPRRACLDRRLEFAGLDFSVGVVPRRIDVITIIDGVEFADAWSNRVVVEMAGLSINVIGLDDLIKNKQGTGRPKDVVDAAVLEKQRRQRE